MEQINIATQLASYNPIHYGSAVTDSSYVVIKPEKDPLARGTVFRIIAHVPKGQVYQLEQTMQAILTILATNDKLEYQSEDFDPTVIANNDDGTISREHTFLMFSKY